MPSSSRNLQVTIIGAGAVGTTIAYALTLKNLAAEIFLLDINRKKSAGEMLDMSDGLCFVETGHLKVGTYKDAKQSDIIIITAGAKQQSGETRLDLLDKNKVILSNICTKLKGLRKDAIVIVVSNPVDVLTLLAAKQLKLPKGRIFGSGTTLDTARLHARLAERLHVSPSSIQGFVMGEHGDSEFVAWSTVYVGGVPVEKIKGFPKKQRTAIAERVRHEAYEIIAKKGATFYGIGTTVADIVEAVVFDQKKILPVSSVLTRYNGISGVALGVPSIVGADGVESHWPVSLTTSERAALRRSRDVITACL